LRAPAVAALLAAALVFCPAAALADDGEKKPDDAAEKKPDEPAAKPAPGEGATDDAADRKAAARARFEKGRQLSGEGAWAAALAEFLASRELYATSGNTLGAASSLRKLARFDEALDMFEVLLRDHAAALAADVRTAAQREIVELRGLVGTIEIEQAEIGASIAVDGRARGEYPAPSPLRVAAGSHVVRVSKEGFETFEARVDVAGNGTARVAAKLRALAASGRLQVVEQGGGALDVIVDGLRIGRTPWEGALAPGEHVLLLSGDGELGTLPVSVSVKVNATAHLTLAAEKLASRIRVEPEPITASVAIDAVAVGQGMWEGRLRAGAHKIEVAAPGFGAVVREVKLVDGERAVVRVPLPRDESSPFWRKPPPPSRFLAEVAGAVPIVPSFGGDIAAGCGGGCTAAPGIGAYVAARGGYELSSGLGFGLAVGFVLAEQSVTGRKATLQPVGLEGEAQGTLDHTLAIRRGVLVGPWLGFSYGERFPLHVRLAAGPLFAWVGETRSGSMTPVREGANYPVGPLSVATFTPFVHVTPDVRVGYRITPRFEVTVGVDALVLIPLSAPAWDAKRAVNAGADGIGTFPADRFVGDVLFGIAPGVGARYDFL
jgi:hypothetical protein